jgi:hypothetical protein
MDSVVLMFCRRSSGQPTHQHKLGSGVLDCRYTPIGRSSNLRVSVQTNRRPSFGILRSALLLRESGISAFPVRSRIGFLTQEMRPAALRYSTSPRPRSSDGLARRQDCAVRGCRHPPRLCSLVSNALWFRPLLLKRRGGGAF